MRGAGLALLLLIYSIASIGFAYVIGHSVATRWIRTVWYGPLSREEQDQIQSDPTVVPRLTPRRLPVALMECPACLGVWIGAFIGWLIADAVPFLSTPVVIVLAACYTAGSNLILAKLTRIMD